MGDDVLVGREPSSRHGNTFGVILAVGLQVIDHGVLVQPQPRQRDAAAPVDLARHRSLQVEAHHLRGAAEFLRIAAVPKRQQDVAVAGNEDPGLRVLLVARQPRQRDGVVVAFVTQRKHQRLDLLQLAIEHGATGFVEIVAIQLDRQRQRRDHAQTADRAPPAPRAGRRPRPATTAAPPATPDSASCRSSRKSRTCACKAGISASRSLRWPVTPTTRVASSIWSLRSDMRSRTAARQECRLPPRANVGAGGRRPCPWSRSRLAARAFDASVRAPTDRWSPRSAGCCDHGRMTELLPDCFSNLALTPALMQGVQALGYSQMTPIQAHSLPAILDGRDLIAQAPTGSGKTAAFGLGLLHRLDPAQIGTAGAGAVPDARAGRPGRQAACASSPSAIPNLKLSIAVPAACRWRRNWPRWQHAPHVVVGTPGRVQELLRKRALDFCAACARWCSTKPTACSTWASRSRSARSSARRRRSRQTLLFSATFPDAVRAISRGMLRDPVEVTVEGARAPRGRSSSASTRSTRRSKHAALAGAAAAGASRNRAWCSATCAAIPTRSCRSLAHLRLHRAGAARRHGTARPRRSAGALRQPQLQRAGGQRRRRARTRRQGSGAVVNYDLPTDADTYVHRIGRTGRAGAAAWR